MAHRGAKAISAEDREARLFQEVARTGLRFEGAPIAVRFRPQLTAHRGALFSGAAWGQPVFAGSFLRKREIILDSSLLNDSSERARILVHELFHFVWQRLGNRDRRSWSRLLEAERNGRARGELGWSSEWRKQAIDGASMEGGGQPLKWRQYICESFCDTSAWMYSDVGDHKEFTLARRWRAKRQEWFRSIVETRKQRLRI